MRSRLESRGTSLYRYIGANYIFALASFGSLFAALVTALHFYLVGLLALVVLLLLFVILSHGIAVSQLRWKLLGISILSLFILCRFFGAQLIDASRISAIDGGLLGKKRSYTVSVISEPVLDHDNLKLTVAIESVDSVGSSLLQPRAQSKAPRFLDVSYGDRCDILGVLSIPENFNDFNYREYLANRGIHYQLVVDEINCHDSGKLTLLSLVLQLKDALKKPITSTFVEPQASLLTGIMFGDDPLFSEHFDTALRNSGSTHIISASGYNVSMIQIFVGSLLGERVLLRSREKITLILIWIFVCMAAFSPSIVRASILLSIKIGAKLSGSLFSMHNAIPLSVLIFQIINPKIVFMLSFQLSLLAMVGIIYITPLLESLFSSFFDRRFVNLFAPTLACTLTTLPIINLNFGQFSYLGVVSNMLILPVIESTMPLGYLFTVLKRVSDFAAKPVELLIYGQLRYFELVVRWFGELDELAVHKLYFTNYFEVIVFYIISMLLLFLLLPDTILDKMFNQ